ncbi:transcriptional regulator [Opitutaceae bacterium TAV1]|nr:transcriptional regulator [Opitutaceae bacterium TAV1]
MPRRRRATSTRTLLSPVSGPSGPFPALAVERARLPAEVARRIAEELRQGRWTNHLPGERKLAEMLQVSRTTLRPALAELEKQGWLRTAHGRRREVVVRRHATGAPAAGQVVVMLSPRPLENIDPFIVFQLESLRELLARRGMSLSIAVRPSCYTNDAATALGHLVAEEKACVWLLWLSTQSMQEWFLAKGLPHIVLGSAFHAEASISVDLDHFATSRHAALTFRRLGHRRIALIISRLGLAGNSMAEAGFRAGAAEESGGEPLVVDVIKHDDSPEGIRRSVDHLLVLKPRPTGVLSVRGLQTVSVITALLGKGLRIPGDISIISRDDDPALDFVNPVPARYYRSPSKFARLVFKLITGCLAMRNVVQKAVRVFPEFQSRESLGPAPGKS